MNAVEIEEAIAELALAEFDQAEFPFQFLAAFGNNEVTLKRLRKVGSSSRHWGGSTEPDFCPSPLSAGSSPESTARCTYF